MLFAKIENAKLFDILEVGVDCHVEIVDITFLDLQEFLVELGVLPTFLDDVGVFIERVIHYLEGEVHPTIIACYRL